MIRRHFYELAGVPIAKGSFCGCVYKQLPKRQPPASSEVVDKPWHTASALEKNTGKLLGIFKVNRQMWFRCFLWLQQAHRAHLLSVPLTTQTDIAPVKYNLELTGEWLLSFHSISPSWLRSKGITHQYPPQPLCLCVSSFSAPVCLREI